MIKLPVKNLHIKATSNVDLQDNIENVYISKKADGTKTSVGSGVNVSKMVVDSKMSLSGSGKIDKLDVNADNVHVGRNITVKNTNVAKGVKNPSVEKSASRSSSSGGGGGRSSRPKPQAPKPQAPEPQAPKPQAPEPQAPKPQPQPLPQPPVPEPQEKIVTLQSTVPKTVTIGEQNEITVQVTTKNLTDKDKLDLMLATEIKGKVVEEEGTRKQVNEKGEMKVNLSLEHLKERENRTVFVAYQINDGSIKKFEDSQILVQQVPIEVKVDVKAGDDQIVLDIKEDISVSFDNNKVRNFANLNFDPGKTGLEKGTVTVDQEAKMLIIDFEKDAKNEGSKMMKNQILKCTTSGFITGFGGLITLPIAVPANITNVLYVQMRMIACTAYMAGYDLYSDQTKTLVYACLAGVAVNNMLKAVGVKFGEKFAISMIKKIPGSVCIKINQRVGFRFLTKFGEKGLIRSYLKTQSCTKM